MSVEKYGRPVMFYALSTLIPWAFWFAAAYVSHLTPSRPLYGVLIGILGGMKLFGILGIIYGPLITTAFLTLTDIYYTNYQQMVDPCRRLISSSG